MSLATKLVVQAATIPRVPNAFLDYLRENAHVYERFENMAVQKIGLGYKHYSSRAIVHILRHETEVNEGEMSSFKISDHISPYISRLFAVRYPEYKDFFKMKRLSKTEDSKL